MKVCTDACLFGAWMATRVPNQGSILDIGGGTGLLMMMLAQKSNSHIHGVELEDSCFLQLGENISRSPWKERLTAGHNDIREFQSRSGYDFIITNPPFYENDLPSTSKNEQLARHGSELTFGELINAIERNLSEEGRFGILLPFQRWKYFDKISSSKNFFRHETLFIRHSPVHSFFRACSIYGRKRLLPVQQSEISIRTKPDGEYTGDFVELLRDYYLYL